MKVKITPRITYEIEIDGTSFIGFEKVSEWEGMIKYQAGCAVVIVEKPFPDIIKKVFDPIFSGNKVDDSEECKVVKISPSLAPTEPYPPPNEDYTP